MSGYGQPNWARPKPHKPNKGLWAGACNREACQDEGDTFWFNKSTRKFYCGRCARLINDANMPADGPLCERPETPAGMVAVSYDQFYAVINPLDVSPSVEHSPDYSVWELRNRTVVGRTYPGWKHSGNPNNPKRYYLIAARAPQESLTYGAS